MNMINNEKDMEILRKAGEAEATLAEIVKNQELKRYKSALEHIAYGFKTPEEMREEDIGLSYEEHLEMAYENIIFVAMQALDDTFS